ncbi:MAG: amidase [Isosphaeraceae bacterium]
MTTPRHGPLVATAADLAEGRRKAIEVVEDCLRRLDRDEPSVHAWVRIDRESARDIARSLDLQRKPVGPLHGIPIGVKDIIDVAGMPTAAGFAPWSDRIADRDAPIVARLRAAGAIILGKTVTTPLAWIDPPPTRNPRNLDRTPGGSSSGSAAAVASAMCLGALGSQTGGSISRPASYCGVCGLKPSYGVLETEGIVPLATSLDHPGAIASTVADLSQLWQALSGAFSRPRWIDPPRLGRVQGLFDDLCEPSMREGFARAVKGLEKAGALIDVVAMPPLFDSIGGHFRTILAFEAARFHRPWWERYGEAYPKEIRALVEEGLAIGPGRHAESRRHQDALKAEMASPFDRFHALIVPATKGAAPDRTTTGDPAFNIPWSYAGLPTVSLPFGLDAEGMPLAFQLVGPHGGEDDLLALAEWCERKIAFDPGATPQ